MTRRSWLVFLSVLVVGASLLRSPRIAAEGLEPECDPEDPELCAVPLSAGEAAPYDGQLLTTELAINLGQKAHSFDVRLKLELKRAEEKYRLELDYQKKVNEIDRKSCQEQTELLLNNLKEVQKASWYKHPAFVATVTGVVIIGLTLGGVYVWDAISDDLATN